MSGAPPRGVGPHKDSGFLSFLLQDDQPGLQVEVAPDHWIDALPLPGTLLANPDSRVRQALLPDPEILRRFMARHGVTEEVRLCRVA
ncbi:2OG-Fe(II) oxygenase family protein [Aeromonas caviae]|uniref:2OG-Fe(II) oxygenase family protein n=1 Tax=Aeromonas caviae TaxID=648 RepID=UPI002E17E18F|nr:2OG-Fe(II) oxygenase family protein [Aeromonas caviae]